MIEKYFDWASTSPMCQASLEAYCRYASEYPANPSSTHSLGIKAHEALEGLRDRCAQALGAKSEHIYFTSGGTESDTIALSSLAMGLGEGKVFYSSSEHNAITGLDGFFKRLKYTLCPVPFKKGEVDVQALCSRIDSSTKLVSIMMVNNVTGTINDIQSIAKALRAASPRRLLIHTDAVQAAGKIPLDLESLDVDTAAFSAHKFQGPRGIGMLYNRNSDLVVINKAGGQERGVRGGTEALASIAGMTAALELATKDLEANWSHVASIRSYCMQKLKDNGFTIISKTEGDFSPYILCLAAPPVPSEVFLRVIGEKGYCLSAGSACSSHVKSKTQGVLASLGYPPFITGSSLRLSFGPSTRMEDAQALIEEMIRAKEALC